MIYDIGGTQKRALEEDIEELKEKYGILPECLLCARFCKNYNAPNLSLFVCHDKKKLDKSI